MRLNARHRVEVAVFAPVLEGVEQEVGVFGRQVARARRRQLALARDQAGLQGKHGQPEADD